MKRRLRSNDGSVVERYVNGSSGRSDEIKLINGQLDVTGVTGEVRASCINGRLEAHDLAGRAKLSTINGQAGSEF